MDSATQNGDRWWLKPTGNSLGTSSGFGFAFGDHSNPGTEKYWRRPPSPVAVQEPQPEPQPELEPVEASDTEPVSKTKLPDDPLYSNWDILSSKDRKKREKSRMKKGTPIPGKDFEWPPPPASPTTLLMQDPASEPEPEPEQALEPEEEPVLEPEAEPEPEPELAAKIPDDPLYSNWDILRSKDKKKREKSLLKKGLPIPGKDFEWPPSPPVPLAQDRTPGPEPEPVLEPESLLEPEPEPEPAPTPESVIEEFEPQFEHSAQPEPEPKNESLRSASFPPQSERTVCAQSIATGTSSLLSLLSNIRDTGAFSDLKIKCESSTFNAHCCIVCPQSSYFEKAVKEGSKKITIIKHSFVVEKMLDYLYRGDYNDCKLATEANGYISYGPALPRYVNAIMHVTADEYGIGGLKDLAEKRLVSNLTHEWDDVDFIQLINYVYGRHTFIGSTLRSILARFAARHVSTLKGFESFHEVLNRFPNFMYKFSGEMVERLMQLEKEVT